MTIRINTRDAIVRAAFQLYKENPSASLADIAERAGVGRATLHRYFSGRDDLAVALAKIAIKELDAAATEAANLAASYTDALQLMLQSLVPLAEHQWFLSNQLAESNSEIQREYKRQNAEMADVIKRAQQEGGIAKNLPVAWICEAYDGLLYAAWELVRKDETTAKQAADLAWNTFISGAGSDNG